MGREVACLFSFAIPAFSLAISVFSFVWPAFSFAIRSGQMRGAGGAHSPMSAAADGGFVTLSDFEAAY